MAVSQDIHEYYQEEGSSSSHATATIIDKSKNFIIGTLIALNLIATVAMYNAWRDAAMEARLHQYNLDWFRGHEFADVTNKLKLLESQKCTR
jgi:hypothetical protein